MRISTSNNGLILPSLKAMGGKHEAESASGCPFSRIKRHDITSVKLN